MPKEDFIEYFEEEKIHKSKQNGIPDYDNPPPLPPPKKQSRGNLIADLQISFIVEEDEERDTNDDYMDYVNNEIQMMRNN